MALQNHVLDPTYFYDCIEEFSFNLTLYVKSSKIIDDYGNEKVTYTDQIVRGSLQSQGKSIQRSKDGNTIKKEYDFYCKSLYRIDEGDILQYKDNFYIVTSVNDYDEYGVRSCKLDMITLTAYRDLADYVKYKNGTKLV